MTIDVDESRHGEKVVTHKIGEYDTMQCIVYLGGSGRTDVDATWTAGETPLANHLCAATTDILSRGTLTESFRHDA